MHGAPFILYNGCQQRESVYIVSDGKLNFDFIGTKILNTKEIY